ncbi:MAG: hypothetical protein KAS96_10100 [Planctomycetes bacterium]|nr:hypothetical protein [Planctomycetota bacterium]
MNNKYVYKKFYNWAKKRVEGLGSTLDAEGLECYYEDFAEYLTVDDDLISNLISSQSIYCQDIELDKFIPYKGYIMSQIDPSLFLMFLDDTGFQAVDSVDIFENVI